MQPLSILYYLLGYFILISIITWYTTRKADSLSFYLGNKKSPWPLVAFGMIGTSISGVTFISVTGMVAASKFSYLQFVLGLTVGYQIIAFVLLPMYYRLNLTSIYTYLDLRFGTNSHKVGSFYFLLARTLGAAARLYLVVEVLNDLVFKSLGIPFEVSVAFIIVLIFVYTVKGGVKTIVYTDTIQTSVMILAVFVCIWEISKALHQPLSTIASEVNSQGYTAIFTSGAGGFWKNFLSGIFICVGMTGLDQDLMQKNLSIKNIDDAQKNMLSFSAISLVVNLLFLTLGAFIAYYMQLKGIKVARPDLAFGEVATHYFSSFGALIFVVGLVAISFASADSALTALTTSFCIDILNFDAADPSRVRLRQQVHFGFSILSFLLIIFLFKGSQNSVITIVYAIGSYTYGPLIAMYAFGLLVKRSITDKLVPYIAVISALIIVTFSMIAAYHSIEIGTAKITMATLASTHGFTYFTALFNNGFGTEVIIYNALLTFAGLFIFSRKQENFIRV